MHSINKFLVYAFSTESDKRLGSGGKHRYNDGWKRLGLQVVYKEQRTVSPQFHEAIRKAIRADHAVINLGASWILKKILMALRGNGRRQKWVCINMNRERESHMSRHTERSICFYKESENFGIFINIFQTGLIS